MSKVLVTGGAGYIGSHTIVELLNAGQSVLVLDNLSNSSITSLERVAGIAGVGLLIKDPRVKPEGDGGLGDLRVKPEDDNKTKPDDDGKEGEDDNKTKSDNDGFRLTFIEGDIRDQSLLRGLFSAFEIEAVVHFAGLKAVGESG